MGGGNSAIQKLPGKGVFGGISENGGCSRSRENMV